MEIDINIIEVVSVCMAQNNEKFIGRTGIFYNESKRGFKTAFPGMTGYCN
jgi:hypothetical protein